MPVVDSPELDGSEAPVIAEAETIRVLEAIAETYSAPEAHMVAVAQPASRSYRFALLAAAIALGAGGGSYLGIRRVRRLSPYRLASCAAEVGGYPRSRDGHADAFRRSSCAENQRRCFVAHCRREFGKLGDRLDNLERAQVDPAGKLARLVEAVDRLDKRLAAMPEITGSIAARPAPGAAMLEPVPMAPIPLPPPDADMSGHVLDGWLVQDVRNGRALIENRYGRVFVVGSGSLLPGIGRVEAVERQRGEWVVVTQRGVITSRVR